MGSDLRCSRFLAPSHPPFRARMASVFSITGSMPWGRRLGRRASVAARSFGLSMRGIARGPGTNRNSARKYVAAESPSVTAPSKLQVALADTLNSSAKRHHR